MKKLIVIIKLVLSLFKRKKIVNDPIPLTRAERRLIERNYSKYARKNYYKAPTIQKKYKKHRDENNKN